MSLASLARTKSGADTYVATLTGDSHLPLLITYRTPLPASAHEGQCLPVEADSRTIRRLIEATHRPDDLRKACSEMQKAAKVSYKTIKERFDAEAERYEAETMPLIEDARMKQLANPKGAQQLNIQGLEKCCSDATVKIGEVILQQGQECVLLTALNSQAGSGMYRRNYKNKLGAPREANGDEPVPIGHYRHYCVGTSAS